jgi:predicted lipid-binding transport protein (Tim44 family)
VRHVYVTVPKPELTEAVVRELLNEGVKAERIRLFVMQPLKYPSLSVAVSRYRPPRSAMLRGGLVGGVVGVLLLLSMIAAGLTAGGLGAVLMLLLYGLAGALVGMMLGFWGSRSREVRELEDALLRGEAVMVVGLEAEEVARVERQLKSAHPELLILGTDPSGTPPFP